jgi:hypothetical protein
MCTTELTKDQGKIESASTQTPATPCGGACGLFSWAAEDGEARIFREAGIGFGKFVEEKEGAAVGLDFAGMLAGVASRYYLDFILRQANNRRTLLEGRLCLRRSITSSTWLC